MNRLTTMSRTWLQDIWEYGRAWRRVLPHNHEASRGWLLTLVIVGLLIYPFAAKADIPDRTMMRLMTSADYAVCHYPDDRGSYYVKLNGHEFDVHETTVVHDRQNPRKILSIYGQISHKLAWRPDDEIWYKVTYADGKPTSTSRIERGGLGPILRLPFDLIGIDKIKLFGVEVKLNLEAIPTVASYLAQHVEGRGWEDQAEALIAEIAATGAIYDYCVQMSWTEWTSEKRAPVQCPSNEGAGGYACKGDYCSLNKLGCVRVPSWTALDEGKTYWSPYFPEEGANAVKNGYFCNGMVTGISCTGKYCDNISVECTPLKAGRFSNCQWSAWQSDEHGEFTDFGPGNYITGMQCRGSYCDDVRFQVCTIEGSFIPVPPGPWLFGPLRP